MRMIVDTNRLIAAIVKDGTTRKIITHINIDFFYIECIQNEMKKYKNEILKKANISEMEFERILNNLLQKMVLVDDALIETSMDEAKKIMKRIDNDDVPFIAAALVVGASIWTDDRHFKKQDKVKVFTTEELMKQLHFNNYS